MPPPSKPGHCPGAAPAVAVAVPNAGMLGWHPWALWGTGWALLLSAQVAGGSPDPR